MLVEHGEYCELSTDEFDFWICYKYMNNVFEGKLLGLVRDVHKELISSHYSQKWWGLLCLI